MHCFVERTKFFGIYSMISGWIISLSLSVAVCGCLGGSQPQAGPAPS